MCLLHACSSIHGGGWLDLIRQPLVSVSRNHRKVQFAARKQSQPRVRGMGGGEGAGWTLPPNMGRGGSPRMVEVCKGGVEGVLEGSERPEAG